MGIKQLEENGFMSNTALSNLLQQCVESCYRYEWLVILFMLFRAHCAKNIK